jgi:TetR/AcrR family transcriptional regulator, cholesterol catabolism regulator
MASKPNSRHRLAPPAQATARGAFGNRLTANERKDLVLQAAARLFEERGFSGTSMQEIADELDVTKAALYHYVDSKEQMLYEIHDAFISSMLEEATLFLSDEDDPVEQLRLFVSSIFRVIAEYRPYVRAFFRDFAFLQDELHAGIQEKRDQYEQLVEDCLERGMAAGVFEIPTTARLGAFFVFGACNWAYQWMSQEGGTDVSDLADAWFAMLLKAFLPASA